MAKKDISKFQKALLSKTNVMKEEPKKKVAKKVKKVAKVVEGNGMIDDNTLEKYKALSEKYNIELNELLKFGLNFFLEFEDDLF